MATTPNYGWPIPEDGDGQANGKPWGNAYRDFLEAVDEKLHEAATKSSITRKSVTITPGASVGTVDLGKSFTIQKESASAPGIFRLYRTTSARDSDLTRPVSTDEAAATAGCFLEDVFVASELAIEWCDVPAHSGPDGLCAWSWSGALGETITLEILVLEA